MIEIINKKMDNGEIFTDKFVFNKNFDEILDQRDTFKMFEDEWLNIYNQVKRANLDKEMLCKIDQLRERVFMQVSDLNGGELCAYVSDDIELITKAYACNITSPWLEKFTQIYLMDIFPFGDIIKDFSFL